MNDLNLIVMFRKYWLIVLMVGIIAMAVAIMATFILSPKYEAKVGIYIIPKDDAVIAGTMVNPKQLYAGTIGQELLTPEIIYQTVKSLQLDKIKKKSKTGLGGILQFIKKQIFIAWIYAKYGHIKDVGPFEEMVAAVGSSVDVGIVEDSNIIELKIAWDDPKIAALLVEELSKQFISYNRNKNLLETGKVLSNIDNEINIRKKRLKKSGLVLFEFKSENGLTANSSMDLAVTPDSATQASLMELEKQLATAEKSLDDWNGLYESTKICFVTKQDEIRVLGPVSVPVYPVKPVKILYGGIGFIIGIMLALFVAAIIELRNKKIYTADDVRDALDARLLADISKSSKT